MPADLDAPHSWTYVGDVARTLVAVAADENAWGRPWHVPTAPAVSIRALATGAAELAGAPAARVAKMPAFVPRLADSSTEPRARCSRRSTNGNGRSSSTPKP
jgi:nucleoside-diphosphate-sugar epimerase